MANLTLSIDEEILKRARLRALERGTSINALVKDCLTAFAGGEAHAEATGFLLDASRRARSGRRGKRVDRDELHERR